eukprot:COSAG01_NODE_1470_length_10206_cov_12.111408_4_plen_79_part_00
MGEAAFARFNLKQIKNPTVRNCFTKCGQNIFDNDLTPFETLMQKYNNKTLYKSLQESYQQRMIDDRTAVIQEPMEVFI